MGNIGPARGAGKRFFKNSLQGGSRTCRTGLRHSRHRPSGRGSRPVDCAVSIPATVPPRPFPSSNARYLPIVAATFACGLVDEFDSEMARAQFHQPRRVFRPGLRPAVEQGVAAAGVRLERMFQPDPVAHFDFMLVTRAAAIGVVRSACSKRRRRRSAPCGTSGMCWWRVISNHSGGADTSSASSCVMFKSYDAVRRSRPKRFLKYSADKPLATLNEKSATRRAAGEELQMIVIAQQIAVRLAGTDLFENPLLARFENARRRGENFGLGPPADCRARKRATASRYFFGSSNSQ